MPRKTMPIDRALAILGLGPTATMEQARRAYRGMVKRWHPDQFARYPEAQVEAEATLKIINQAYAVVKSHLAARPDPAAGSAETRSTAAPDKDSAKPESFQGAFHFHARTKAPPRPATASRTTPGQPPPAADFQDALRAAAEGRRTFDQPPPAAPSKPKPSRPLRRMTPIPRKGSRSMRVEPVEPVTRVRPVAPIHPIGSDD